MFEYLVRCCPSIWIVNLYGLLLVGNVIGCKCFGRFGSVKVESREIPQNGVLEGKRALVFVKKAAPVCLLLRMVPLLWLAYSIGDK